MKAFQGKESEERRKRKDNGRGVSNAVRSQQAN